MAELSAEIEKQVIDTVIDLDWRITSAQNKYNELITNISAIIFSLSSVETDYPELSILEGYNGSKQEIKDKRQRKRALTNQRDAIIKDWQKILNVMTK